MSGACAKSTPLYQPMHKEKPRWGSVPGGKQYTESSNPGRVVVFLHTKLTSDYSIIYSGPKKSMGLIRY